MSETKSFLQVKLKRGQIIQIGEGTFVYAEIIQNQHGQGVMVRVGVSAPRDQKIHRTEEYGPRSLTREEYLAWKKSEEAA